MTASSFSGVLHVLVFSTVKIDVANIAFRDATFPQLIHDTGTADSIFHNGECR